jgi:hypothetical protein
LASGKSPPTRVRAYSGTDSMFKTAAPARL